MPKKVEDDKDIVLLEVKNSESLLNGSDDSIPVPEKCAEHQKSSDESINLKKAIVKLIRLSPSEIAKYLHSSKVKLESNIDICNICFFSQ